MEDPAMPTDSEIEEIIENIIPDALRPIIDNAPDEYITGANYLARTLTAAGQVLILTPTGQAVVPGMDLPQMVQDFDTTVSSLLATDIEIPNAFWLGNSVQSQEVTNHFLVDSLTNIPITHTVNYFQEAPVFTEENQLQLQSLLDRISSATSGATENRFFDADDDNNLIEITAEDTAPGGLRAWGGNDRILGSQGNDIVNADAGKDEIVGAGGDDLLQGGRGKDLIAGGEGADLVLGNNGDDELFGGEGNDVIRGGSGVDVLTGNAGNDCLIGDGYGDLLMGSEGADQFILRGDILTDAAAGAAVTDRILDFNPSEGDFINIAFSPSTPGMDLNISFAVEDVNLDGTPDTAILYADRVVGVILSIEPINLTSSIFRVAAQDTTLTSIGESF